MHWNVWQKYPKNVTPDITEIILIFSSVTRKSRIYISNKEIIKNLNKNFLHGNSVSTPDNKFLTNKFLSVNYQFFVKYRKFEDLEIYQKSGMLENTKNFLLEILGILKSRKIKNFRIKNSRKCEVSKFGKSRRNRNFRILKLKKNRSFKILKIEKNATFENLEEIEISDFWKSGKILSFKILKIEKKSKFQNWKSQKNPNFHKLAKIMKIILKIKKRSNFGK